MWKGRDFDKMAEVSEGNGMNCMDCHAKSVTTSDNTIIWLLSVNVYQRFSTGFYPVDHTRQILQFKII